MTVEIDAGAGFCGGVIHAIVKAEEELGKGTRLYCLGSIVHNEKELSRLKAMGLEEVDSLSDIVRPEGKTVLIRAHGVPPSVYEEAGRLGLKVLDCTCPVVLKLQGHIRSACSQMKECGGQVVIFGKVGHPEVLGLVGQGDAAVLVVENRESLGRALASGALNCARPVELFSQTTKSPEGYAEIRKLLSERMQAPLIVHDTICRQVASRHERLSAFTRSHDVVIFVAGSESSNGKVLFELCRKVNPRTRLVAGAEQLRSEWFEPGMRVGVSGATSTPLWLLENVAQTIENLQ